MWPPYAYPHPLQTSLSDAPDKYKVGTKIGNALTLVGVSEEELLLITAEGKVIRIKTTQFRSLSRATQGVRIINLDEKDLVCAVAKVRES